MRLQRIAIYRLTRILAGILPAGLAVLIAIAAWDYWSRTGEVRSATVDEPVEFPDDLAIRTDGFTFRKSEGGKPLFKVVAKETLGYRDKKTLGRDVDVEIYPKTEGEITRHIHGDECSYDEKNEEIFCAGNVTIQLDEKTTSRTEEVTYSHSTRLISSNVRTHIEQPGQMSGSAGQLRYFMDSGLLALDEDVMVDLTQGGSLRAGNAVFQQKENWANVASGVEVRSANGWIRGRSGRAELQPGSYRPTRITVESDVTAESQSSDASNAWSLRSNWLQSDLTPEGNIHHVLARGAAQVDRKAATGDEILKGNEIEAHMDAAGVVTDIEARQDPVFESGQRRLLADTKILIDPKGTVTTQGTSTLDAGDSKIEGRDFSIQQGDDIRVFRTQHRAVLTSKERGGRVTRGDVTTASFDAKTNQLLKLTQTGNVSFVEGPRQGNADKVTVTDAGQTILLETKARITDDKTGLTAPRITLDQRNKSINADGGVVMTDSSRGDQRVRITAERVRVEEQTVEYWNGVHFLRGEARIDADHLIGYTKENRFVADGHVSSWVGVFHTKSEEMDFTDSGESGQSAHYRGKVWSQRTDNQKVIVLETADMKVSLKDGAVQTIQAEGAVKVTQGTRRGRGEKAVYDARTGAVVLSGSETADAELVGPEGTTKGSEIETSADGRVASVRPSKVSGGASTSINNVKK